MYSFVFQSSCYDLCANLVRISSFRDQKRSNATESYNVSIPFARNVQRFPFVEHTHKHTYTNTHLHTHIQEYDQVMMGGTAGAPAQAIVGKHFCLILNLLDKINMQLILRNFVRRQTIWKSWTCPHEQHALETPAGSHYFCRESSFFDFNKTTVRMYISAQEQDRDSRHDWLPEKQKNKKSRNTVCDLYSSILFVMLVAFFSFHCVHHVTV